MNSNSYHFEALVRDSGSEGNKWTKERLCGGEQYNFIKVYLRKRKRHYRGDPFRPVKFGQ